MIASPFALSRVGSSKANTGGTFGDAISAEVARSKSLKIDHAALQRVMNVDGSLKQIDGESARGAASGCYSKPPWFCSAS